MDVVVSERRKRYLSFAHGRLDSEGTFERIMKFIWPILEERKAPGEGSQPVLFLYDAVTSLSPTWSHPSPSMPIMGWHLQEKSDSCEPSTGALDGV